MKSMGKELASATGKGHKAIATNWICLLIVGCASAAIFVFCANKFGYTARYTGYTFGSGVSTEAIKNEMYYVYMGLAALVAVVSLVEGHLINSRIVRTFVRVYENGIEGSSVVPKFPLSLIIYGSLASLQMSEFQLTYDQVSSVDVVNGETLLIHAGNVQHKIYAMNARDVRDAIMSQKNTVIQVAAQS